MQLLARTACVARRRRRILAKADQEDDVAIVNMLEAKTNLSRLVDAVEKGIEPEIVIARNGRPAAKLVPVTAKKRKLRLGLAKGKFVVPDDIDRDNDLVARMFYGEDFDEEEFIRKGDKG